MNNKAKYIITFFLLFSFTLSALGVNLYFHTCSSHQSVQVAINQIAKCPCHHSHIESIAVSTCNCNNENVESSNTKHLNCKDIDNHLNENHQNNIENKEHIHNIDFPEYSDDCCNQNEIDLAIDDAFSLTNNKIELEINEYYILPLISIQKKESQNKILNILISQININIVQNISPLLHIYNSSSSEDPDLISIV